MLRHGDVAQIGRDRRGQCLPGWAARQTMRDVFGKPVNWTRFCLGMDARVRDIAQPGAHVRIGRCSIEDLTLTLQTALQGPDKTVLQILDEPFDFAFGLRPIWRAHARTEAVMFGKLDHAPIGGVAQGWPAGFRRAELVSPSARQAG